MPPFALPVALTHRLHACARRYRAPSLPVSIDAARAEGFGAALAFAIEQVRETLARGTEPADEVRALFIEGLSQLLDHALRPDDGDASFQSMGLQHRWPDVRAFAHRHARSASDRRTVQTTIRAFAHPARTERRPEADAALKQSLLALHDAGERADWMQVRTITEGLLRSPERLADDELKRSLERLQQAPALHELLATAAESHEPRMQRYLQLLRQQGPTAGTEDAHARGRRAQARGAAVEAQAADALSRLADQLRHDDPSADYRVVTGLLVPGSIPGDPQRAKSEWDAALLRSASQGETSTTWDLCLLLEAKASADAATTDLYTLQRGLQRLQQATADIPHVFASDAGDVTLTGRSLQALNLGSPTAEGSRPDGAGMSVLYCSDAPSDRRPPWLNPASRMQLLSAPASIDWASHRCDQDTPADPARLLPVWHQLLTEPGFEAVRQQYPTLRFVRELMVHPDDLRAAADGALPSHVAGSRDGSP